MTSGMLLSQRILSLIIVKYIAPSLDMEANPSTQASSVRHKSLWSGATTLQVSCKHDVVIECTLS